MSGIFISSEKMLSHLAIDNQLSFTPDTWSESGVAATVDYTVTRLDSAELWAPATDPVGGTVVLLGGRVALDETEWSKAESLPYKGGLACRWLLDAWLTQPKYFYERLNGAFLVVVIEPLFRRLHLFTDRLGVFPIYHAPGYPLNLCSHPDVLANVLKVQGHDCPIDWTTVAECLSTASAVQPHTYYEPIRQLEAAAHYQWHLGERPALVSQEICWQPSYLTQEPSDDVNGLAEWLGEAFKKAVARRTLQRFGTAGVMLSGGADSRAALFAARDPSKVLCYTMFDEPNEELLTAQKLAAVAGAKHTALQRSPDYYGENAEEIVKISGGMWSIIDAHYQGFASHVRGDDLGCLLTGCYADYMFKGLLLNRTHRKLFGRNLPLYDLGAFNFQFYQTHAQVEPAWNKKVYERLIARYPETLRNDYAKFCLPIEDLRLRPLAREADASGRSTLWRTLPWDHLLSDSEILDVYGHMAASTKLNGIAFGKAVELLSPPAGKLIRNNNYGTPIGADENERIFWFVVASLKRKVKRLAKLQVRNTWKLATTGSWPNWSYYVAHSPAIARLWNNTDHNIREALSGVLGFNPWNTKLNEWARGDHMLFFRLLALSIWLKHVKMGS